MRYCCNSTDYVGDFKSSLVQRITRVDVRTHAVNFLVNLHTCKLLYHQLCTPIGVRGIENWRGTTVGLLKSGGRHQ